MGNSDKQQQGAGSSGEQRQQGQNESRQPGQQGGGSSNQSQQGGDAKRSRQQEQSGSGQRSESLDDDTVTEGNLDAGNIASPDASKENREKKSPNR